MVFNVFLTIITVLWQPDSLSFRFILFQNCIKLFLYFIQSIQIISEIVLNWSFYLLMLARKILLEFIFFHPIILCLFEEFHLSIEELLGLNIIVKSLVASSFAHYVIRYEFPAILIGLVVTFDVETKIWHWITHYYWFVYMV